MSKILIFTVLVLIVIGVIFFFTMPEKDNESQNSEELVQTSFESRPRENNEQKSLSELVDGDFIAVNSTKLRLEIVKTREEQIRGLSGRENLEKDTGMLFVYEQPTTPSFWMKEMNFSIDIIWIGSDSKIVDISENLSLETYPNTFRPQAPIQYVLEVNAGWALDHNVAVGDMIQF